MKPRFDNVVQKTLQQAGWFPRREISAQVSAWAESLRQSDSLEIFPEAERILREFGGLTIGAQGPGVTCAKGLALFDPLSAQGEGERLSVYAEAASTKLYPLGEELGQSGWWFVVGEDRRVYSFGDCDFMIVVGDFFEEALRNLIYGIAGIRVEAPRVYS
jgi:hypothetical protein